LTARKWYYAGMHKTLRIGLVAVLVIVIVAVDVSFFRNHFWERLIANSGIVLVFAVLYFRFLK
jgi:hypothetical protein